MATKALQQAQRIEQTAIPPLSQSRQFDLGCEHLYSVRHIDGVRTDSQPSRRGNEIHKITAAYVSHLIKTRQKQDGARFDLLCETASPEAIEVLDTFRESFTFNPDAIVGTEIYISLDADFNPSKTNIEYEGTLDLVTMESEREAAIHDWKSYFQIIDADTFQAKMYSLLLFCLNPSLQKVTFYLDFVRYGGANRSVEFTREDVPKLKRLVETQRARQKELHASESLKATPGRHCSFCPRLTDLSCPMSETNPYATMTPAQRVGFAVFLAQATKENTRLIKDLMLEGGPVSYQDGNGNPYIAEFRRQERKSYPLAKTYQVLEAWGTAHPKDNELFDSLTVSGLSSPLKAKKRAPLNDALVQIANVKIQTRFHVGLDDDEEEDE